MKAFNDNENTPMKVNRPTYNWLNKLIETQIWEDCFYFISRQGFYYGFSFTHDGETYELAYEEVGGVIPNGLLRKGLLLKALINGYTLAEPLYKVVDRNGFLLLRLHNNEAVKSVDSIRYEQMLEYTKKFYHLTEEQIKNYDERYWAFAVEIEEEDYE